MENQFKIINPEAISDNPFKLIDKDWMLITAGSAESFNTMTAAWGGLGILWKKQVAYIFVRPTRYTYEFMEKNQHFTLSFFEEKYRPALELCGSKSGRDINKMTGTGLTPAFTGNGSVYFSEARLVMECRKIYYTDVKPEQFLDPGIQRNYPLRDYHRMYIGEIVQCMG